VVAATSGRPRDFLVSAVKFDYNHNHMLSQHRWAYAPWQPAYYVMLDAILLFDLANKFSLSLSYTTFCDSD